MGLSYTTIPHSINTKTDPYMFVANSSQNDYVETTLGSLNLILVLNQPKQVTLLLHTSTQSL